MNNEIIYSNLGYTTEQIKKAISDSLNIEKVIRDKAYNFVNLSSFQNLNQATKPNTIYFVETEAYSYLVFVLYQDDIITQIAMVSDGSIRYRTGTIQTIQSNEIFVPNMEFVSILSNYYNKEEIEDLFFEVNKRLDKLETPARVVSGTQKSLVGITTLQTEAGAVSDNKIAFGLDGAALIDIQGYVDIAFECRGEIAVYIDDEKVYYFDFNTLSYIGSPEFVGNINKGIRVTNIGSSAITFTRFSVPSYKGGILTDELAEKVIKTEVFTKAEKDKLASSEVFTSDEKKELARVSGIGNATYTMVDTSLIDLEKQGLISHDPDTAIKAKTISGGTQVTIKFDAAGSSRFVKIGGTSSIRSYDVLVDGKSLFTGVAPASFSYTGKSQTIEFKSTSTATLKIRLTTFEISEFIDGHATGQQVLDVDVLKEDVKTAQEDISGIESQLVNIYTKEESDSRFAKNKVASTTTKETTLEQLYNEGKAFYTSGTVKGNKWNSSGADSFYINVQGKVSFSGVTKSEYMKIRIDGKEFEGTDFNGAVENKIALSHEDLSIGSVEFASFSVTEYTGGLMSGEDKQKLENTPTTEEVNNLIAESIGEALEGDY